MSIKKFLFASGFVAANLGVCYAAPTRKIVPNAAISFTSKEHHFSVWLPSQPTRSEQTSWVSPLSQANQNQQASSEKPQSFTQTMFKVNSGLVNYTVCVRPPLLFDKFFASIISDWKYRRYDEVKLDEVLGRDLEQIHRSNGMVVRTRLYLTPKTTYSISAIGPEAGMQEQAAQIDKVFDSFRLLEPPVPPAQAPIPQKSRFRPR